MRKFLTDNFAKIGLVVLVLLTTVLVTTIFISKIEFLAKADERINIFPANYSMESVGDTTWQNPQNIFNQDLAEDASLTEFNDDNSAFIQGANYIPVTTTESTSATIVIPPETTTTTISAETTTTISSGTTTTIIDPATTTTTTTTTTTIFPLETTTTTSDVTIETTTTTTLPLETTTTTTIPLAFIKNILSFLIPWAKAEETTTTVTEPTTTTTVTTTTVPSEVTTTETLPTVTTVTTIEGTSTTTSTGITTTTMTPQITPSTETTSTTTTNTIRTEDKKDIILSSLIVSDFDLGEKSFDQMTTQNVQLRLSLASQGQADGKLIISYFYHSEWQNMGEIDLSQEVSNGKNGGYFLYALPVFENFQEFQNFKIKFQISGTQFQKVYLDAVWLEADFKEVGEEPPISGTRGSGTIFFSGCNLHCIFCQNYQISQLGIGQNAYTAEQFALLMLDLQSRKAHNINLVSPTIWSKEIVEGLEIAKERGLTIPVVYNTNGYDNVKVLRQFKGLIEIYLPDFKYADDKLALKFSGVSNYTKEATLAIKEMFNQVGDLVLNSDGIATRGVLVRHLILPGYIKNSIESLKIIREFSENVHLSLMTQYNPAFKAIGDKKLGKNLSLEESEIVIGEMNKIGFVNGWYQPIKNGAAVCLNPDFTKKNPFN